MNPIEKFKQERKERIARQGKDEKFQAASKDWTKASMDNEYVYNFQWMGRPIIQFPQDILALQEIIWKTKPNLIIETGIAHGGSLIFSASMLELLDNNGQVLGIDIDIRSHNRKEIENHPMSKRISLLEGSSIDQNIIDKVYEFAKGKNSIMVILDSMHTHDHVLAELQAYGSLVSKNNYLVVLDTFVEDLPRNYFDNRPWDVGNNPKTAVHQYLKSNTNFEKDRTYQDKLMITVAPDGFLKRIS